MASSRVVPTPDMKRLYSQRQLLRELLSMSRTQRRARGVRAERAQIEHELGAVEYLIERIEGDTATPPGIAASNLP